jgi:hypothetical protein
MLSLQIRLRDILPKSEVVFTTLNHSGKANKLTRAVIVTTKTLFLGITFTNLITNLNATNQGMPYIQYHTMTNFRPPRSR